MNHFKLRHKILSEKIPDISVLLFSGTSLSRNYPANTYPFRAQSHFLYLAGVCPEGSYFLLREGTARLFVPEVTLDDIVWSGMPESAEIIAERSGCEVHELSELPEYLKDIAAERLASLPHSEASQNNILSGALGRLPSLENAADRRLALALIEMRLHNDEAACRELRRACALTVKAHMYGLRALRGINRGGGYGSESDINEAMLDPIIRNGGYVSFNPIISTSGERLHQVKLGENLAPGRLLLVDFGAESPSGWAGDITNTWPVNGKYSGKQALIYNTCLRAHKECAAMLRAGTEWTQVHGKALAVIAEGLQEIGILKGGSVEEYLEDNVISLFMPHGIGHLMGIDVHDMEDLGDLAGYAPGRERSKKFGWNCLRLNRPLAEGMAVTVEPGIYFIPELFERPEFADSVRKYVDRERLAQFLEVHGVRIERDYLITAGGSELLTPDMPTKICEIEDFMEQTL
ncbi:aminopeptidase P N-terminal domain-containing protein [bacterium]|nr:aminopeptidase P N-terminal domain-containing protein [bacterium]